MDKNRLIIETPFNLKTIISYGIILYNREHQRWLLVQRKHSVEFILIIRGSYRMSFITFLIRKITNEEKEILINTLNDPDQFERIYFNHLKLYRSNFEYAKIRFNENRDLIMKLIEQFDFDNNYLDWNWPKGQILFNNSIDDGDRETPFQCAIREFREEIDVELSNFEYVSENYLSETIRTIGGRNIESRYWIIIIRDEFKLNNPIENNEVLNRKWMSKDEVDKKIKNHSIFNQTINLIQSLNVC